MTVRCLIVEDHRLAARELGAILSELGHEVIGVARSCDEAVELMGRGPVDLALIDICLAGEGTGLEVARRFRAAHDAPFLFLTSRSDAAAVGAARDLKANGYVLKPYTLEMIFAAIETALGNFLAARADGDAAGDRSPPAAGEGRGGLAPHVATAVKRRVERDYAQPLTLDDLAEPSGLSRFHFAAMFKQTFGVPPHRYIVQRRIEVASRLLLQTGQSVAEIALAVGYENASHFARVFARETGQSPAVFRRMGGAAGA